MGSMSLLLTRIRVEARYGVGEEFKSYVVVGLLCNL